MTRLLNIRERRRSKTAKVKSQGMLERVVLLKLPDVTMQIGLQASSLAVFIRDVYIGLTERTYINCR